MGWLKPILKRSTRKMPTMMEQLGDVGTSMNICPPWRAHRQKSTQLNWDRGVFSVFPLHFIFCLIITIILLDRGCFACLCPPHPPTQSVSYWRAGSVPPCVPVPGVTQQQVTQASTDRKHWGVGDTYRNSPESQKSTVVLVTWWRAPSRHTFNLQDKPKSVSWARSSPSKMTA